MITRNFKLFLTAGRSIPLLINANQYDHGETWVFTLYDETGQKYTPSSGAIVGIKSDGYVIADTGTVNSAGQVVIIESEQMTAAAGKAIYELEIDGQTHGTANFCLMVEPKPGDGGIVSDSDLSLIQQALDSTNPEAIAQGVSDWMDENLTPTTPVVDASLTVQGAAADAKKVGDEISDVKSAVNQIAEYEVVSETADYLELTDPSSDTVIKTNNVYGHTELRLAVSKGNVLCKPYFRPNGYQLNGLTFTINDDGTITVNGTASADTTYNIAYYQNPPLFKKVINGHVNYGCYMGGCTDGSTSTYYIKDNNGGHVCTTEPVPVFSETVTTGTINMVIVVKSGITLTNKKFYPMLSLTGTEEYTPPITPYSATVDASTQEYTWENITFNSGYNIIATNAHNTLTASYKEYGSLADVQAEIADLSDKVEHIDQWTGKKWVAFGTSLTDNYSQNSYITNGEHAGEHTGKYVPFLLNLSKLSQSAFVNRGIAGGNINGHILYYIRYYTADMANADLITIEGAVNDFATNVPLGEVGDTVPYTNSLLPDSTSEGSFAGACYQAFTTAITNAPNAVVVLLTETTGKDFTGYANYNQLRKNSLGLYQSDYIEMTMKVAEFVGIPVINCGRDSMINAQNPQYIADHIHHTYLGGYQYAKTIWSKLKNIQLKALTYPS